MELGPWAPCIDRLATTPDEARHLLADAVKVLEGRAALLAERGLRVWQPTPEMPALIIGIDEYAELSDDAPDAIKHADSIARRGRAVAVNLVAATQRPTQKAMGQGAVRSQMDVRISFRVRAPHAQASPRLLAHRPSGGGRSDLLRGQPSAARSRLSASGRRRPLSRTIRGSTRHGHHDRRARARRLRHHAVDRARTRTCGGGNGPRPDDRDRHEPPVDLPPPARPRRPRPHGTPTKGGTPQCRS
jgi:DNA helicase HerA-like ATPase